MSEINEQKSDNPTTAKRPDWIRVRVPAAGNYADTKDIIHKLKLNTVCEEAACPNLGECWSQKHATVMIMGDTCTRACAFCNIKTGVPNALNPHEPDNLAQAIGELKLKHVVITSVDRDDLPDGGAEHFAKCIAALRKSAPTTTIEVLTPDFLRKDGCVEIVAKARPDVFNHNIETVPRLYKSIRPGARYFNSLHRLKTVKEIDPSIFTKSGIMVGLGESKEEVIQVMDDLRSADVDFMTIGQYLQPTPNHAPIDRYVTPDEFEYYARQAKAKGFLMVSSSPLTRSSYHAGADFAKMKAARDRMLATSSATNN